MGKGSLAKIAAALAIISVYIYLLGFTGRIESLENSIPAEERPPAETTAAPEDEDDSSAEMILEPEQTAPASEERQIYTYDTTLNVVNGKKPSLADYTATKAMMVIPETTTAQAAVAPDAVLDDSSFPTTLPVTTTTTAPPETTATTTTTTTTPAPETTTAPVTVSESDSSAPTTLPPGTEDEDILTTTQPAPPEITDIEDDTDDDADGDTADTYEYTTPEETSAPETFEWETSDTTVSETTVPTAESGEKLSVYANGTVITGDAVSIVAQAVMAEIGDGFHDEAIKAQAIATYTYFKYYNDNKQNAYAVLKTPSDNVTRCVSEVIGKGIYYNGRLIQAVYSASSAGYTASAKNVWGIDYPYLASRRNDFDALYDINYGKQVDFTADAVRALVQNNTGIVLGDDPSTWFEITSYVDGSYVGTMTVGGYSAYNNGSKNVTITGRVFREDIMEYNLRSSSFDITYTPLTGMFTFTTYGYGHGVGLSQHGANILATQYGYNYEQILKYYYQGTDIY